jgi:hypothetical protein
MREGRDRAGALLGSEDRFRSHRSAAASVQPAGAIRGPAHIADEAAADPLVPSPMASGTERSGLCGGTGAPALGRVDQRSAFADRNPARPWSLPADSP